MSDEINAVGKAGNTKNIQFVQNGKKPPAKKADSDSKRVTGDHYVQNTEITDKRKVELEAKLADSQEEIIELQHEYLANIGSTDEAESKQIQSRLGKALKTHSKLQEFLGLPQGLKLPEKVKEEYRLKAADALENIDSLQQQILAAELNSPESKQLERNLANQQATFKTLSGFLGLHKSPKERISNNAKLEDSRATIDSLQHALLATIEAGETADEKQIQQELDAALKTHNKLREQLGIPKGDFDTELHIVTTKEYKIKFVDCIEEIMAIQNGILEAVESGKNESEPELKQFQRQLTAKTRLFHKFKEFLDLPKNFKLPE